MTLVAAPHQLPDVTATAPDIDPRFRPWDERRARGFGHFLAEDLLRRSEHRTFSNVLRSVPGVRLRNLDRKGYVVALGRGATWCPMAIWLDGVRIYSPGAEETSPFSGGGANREMFPPPNLDDWKITELHAVEIYSAAQTPAQSQMTGSGCGTILLWTRMR